MKELEGSERKKTEVKAKAEEEKGTMLRREKRRGPS